MWVSWLAGERGELGFGDKGVENVEKRGLVVVESGEVGQFVTDEVVGGVQRLFS